MSRVEEKRDKWCHFWISTFSPINNSSCPKLLCYSVDMLSSGSAVPTVRADSRYFGKVHDRRSVASEAAYVPGLPCSRHPHQGRIAITCNKMTSTKFRAISLVCRNASRRPSSRRRKSTNEIRPEFCTDSTQSSKGESPSWLQNSPPESSRSSSKMELLVLSFLEREIWIMWTTAQKPLTSDEIAQKKSISCLSHSKQLIMSR